MSDEDMVTITWTDPVTGTVSEARITLEEAAALQRDEPISRRGDEMVQRWTLGDQAAALRARADQIEMEKRVMIDRAKREEAREAGLLDAIDGLDASERDELLREFPWLAEPEDS